MIPLFDSNAHPTLNGTWLDNQGSNTFSALAAQLEPNRFQGACAVGLANKDDYSHETFIKACQGYPELIPIAGFDPLGTEIKKEINKLCQLGFNGIKIHPRFSCVSLEKHREQIAEVFRCAAEKELVVFLCTYYPSVIKEFPEKDPFYSLVSILKIAPETKVVLLHGGDVNLLRYAELVRFNQNLLLDLSYTLFKYQGSSLDLDIQYLFRTLDQKLCIGTDWPEYNLADLRQRFEFFAQDISDEKRENIGFRNILKLLGKDIGPD
jgi:predicted TIM-barrel fold metal-dependent hydrolase